MMSLDERADGNLTDMFQLSQSEENKCMWTNSKNGTTWQFRVRAARGRERMEGNCHMCHLFYVFTYIYSLLTEKDLFECWNVSVKFFMCICAFHPDTSLFFSKGSPFYSYFVKSILVYFMKIGIKRRGLLSMKKELSGQILDTFKSSIHVMSGVLTTLRRLSIRRHKQNAMWMGAVTPWGWTLKCEQSLQKPPQHSLVSIILFIRIFCYYLSVERDVINIVKKKGRVQHLPDSHL